MRTLSKTPYKHWEENLLQPEKERLINLINNTDQPHAEKVWINTKIKLIDEEFKHRANENLNQSNEP